MGYRDTDIQIPSAEHLELLKIPFLSVKQVGIQPSVLSPLSGVLPLCFQFYTFPINSALFPAVLFISNKSVCLIDSESKFYWLRSKISGWLVRALSPVNHKGLYQGWEQTPVYLLVIVIPQVSISQVSFSPTTTQIIATIPEHKITKAMIHVFEPIYIPRALNTGTCISRL